MASSYICFMRIDDELVDKLSRLAMIEVGADEREQLKGDLEKMIGFVDKLKELDLSGVAPLLHLHSTVSELRQDEPGNMLSKEQALMNASRHDGNYFLVPKVIKKQV